MDKKKNKQIGDLGEEIAREYLEAKGYRILDTNLKLFCGEIDILAEYRKTIVLVEVKTVRGAGFGLAQDLVRYKKQQKLRNLARALEQKYPNRTLRIDVVGVHLYEDPPGIEHIENAVTNG